MVAINFQERFADDVELGRKTQTVRKTWSNGKVPWSKGCRLQLYTGMRHPGCWKIMDAICTSVQAVNISELGVAIDRRTLYAGEPSYIVGGPLPDHYDNDFARADGFDGFEEMLEWIEKTHGSRAFVGWLIKWRAESRYGVRIRRKEPK